MRFQSGNSFSLAEAGSFSLAGLLLGKEKTFLLSTGLCKVSCFLLDYMSYFLLPESVNRSKP